MKTRKTSNSAFTILELVVTLVFVAALTAPVLNTFQVGERLSERSRRSFNAQVLAREMLSEISKKSFFDPDQSDTYSASLLPGPTHEEYDEFAPAIQNGTGENGLPRMLNESLVNRRKYFDDIDDYDGYNTDETILPTGPAGTEHVVLGENLYRDFRVKVRVVGNLKTLTSPPRPLLKNDANLGQNISAIAATTDGRYVVALDRAANAMAVVNTQSGEQIDCCPDSLLPYGFSDSPNAGRKDAIRLSPYIKKPVGEEPTADNIRRYELGDPSKVLLGPSADRFYVLHPSKAAADGYEVCAALSSVDMNSFGSPEVGFHKVEDVNRLPETYFAQLPSNAVERVMRAGGGRIFAAAGKNGLYESPDMGKTWFQAGLPGFVSDRHAVTLLAKSDGYFYAAGTGGIWVAADEPSAPFVRASRDIAETAVITALCAKGEGYLAAGTSDGKVFVSDNAISTDARFVEKNGPASSNRVNCILIDSSFRVWAGTGSNLYYSTDALSNIASSQASWEPFLPTSVDQYNVLSLYSDESGTTPGPFRDLFDSRKNPVPDVEPSNPSLLSTDDALHLFYLDYVQVVPARLNVTSSFDGGKTWTGRTRINSTDSGNYWAHSETADRAGTIHAVFNGQVESDGRWRVYYQRSTDSGRSWLQKDICVGSTETGKPLDELYFGDYALPDNGWCEYGSNHFKRIACTPDNRVFICYSEDRTGSAHKIRFSVDGGVSWPASNVINVPKLIGAGREIIESVDYVPARNVLMLTVMTGTNLNERRTISIDPDSLADVTAGFPGPPALVSVTGSVAPVFSPEGRMLYQYMLNSGVANNNTNLLSSAFPYSNSWNGCSQHNSNPHRTFGINSIGPPAIVNNRAYSFFVSSDLNALNTGGASKVALFSVSDSGGAGFDRCSVYYDVVNSPLDIMASAAHRGKVYVAKKTNSVAPYSDFRVGTLGGELIHVACATGLVVIDPEMLPRKTYDDYSFAILGGLSEVTGSSDGCMALASPKGVYLRNAYRPDMKVNSYGTGGGDYLNLPPLETRTFSAAWLRSFKDFPVRSAYMERGGLIFVVTDGAGIFKSEDAGGRWEKIEAGSRYAYDFSFASFGSPEELNRASVLSRMTGRENDSWFSELSLSTYDLRDGRRDSTMTVVRDADPAKKSQAACFAGSSKVLIFKSDEKRFYVRGRPLKKRVRIPTRAVLTTLSNQVDTGIVVGPGDSLEICFNGKYKTSADDKMFTTPRGLATYYYGVIGSAFFKVGSGDQVATQYFSGTPGTSGNLAVGVADVNGQGEGDLVADITVAPSPVHIAAIPDGAVESSDYLAASPDGKTFYSIAFGSSDSRVFSVVVPDDVSAASVRQVARNAAEPFKVIFSPRRIDGSVTAFVVCRSTIVDISGNKLFGDLADAQIKDAVCTDSGDVIFVDSLGRLFKCMRATEKTVYVTVVDVSERAAGAMPPLTMAKKFFALNSYGDTRAGSLPNRDYLKTRMVFASKTARSAGSANAYEISGGTVWSSYSEGSKYVNVYVVDGALTVVNGTLEIRAGTVVKFKTVDKDRTTAGQASVSAEPSSSLIIGPGGALVARGDNFPAGRVLFTSLDDNLASPSIHTAPDGQRISSDGLPNSMCRQSYFVAGGTTGEYNSKYGPWPGDWGRSELTAGGAAGGLYFTDTYQVDLGNLDTRFGRFLSSQIYPDGKLSDNYNGPRGICEWRGTNIYQIDSTPSLRGTAPASLKAEGGAIVEIREGSRLEFGDSEEARMRHPDFSFICSGSADERVVFRKRNLASVPPGVSTDILFSGLCDVARVAGASFPDINRIALSGANAFFTECDFSSFSSDYPMVLVSTHFDRSAIQSCKVRLKPPSRIEFAEGSSASLRYSRILFSFQASSGATAADGMLSTAGGATPSISHNVIANDAGTPIAAAYPGSKLRLGSPAFVIGNDLRNNGPTPATSCEIFVAGAPSAPLIRSNSFDATRTAVYISGYEGASRLLDGRIENNSFGSACDYLVASDVKLAASGPGEIPPVGQAACDADGNIYMADRQRESLFKIGRNGKVLMRISGGRAGVPPLSNPVAVAVNRTGEIYLLDSDLYKVHKFSPGGEYIMSFGASFSQGGPFKGPCALLVAGDGSAETILVTDSARNRLIRYSNEGNYIEELGRDTPALAFENFSRPEGMAATSDGKFVYVADGGNNRIQKVKLESSEEDVARFEVVTRAFSIDSADPYGFEPGNIAEEGCYLEIIITARNADRSVNRTYQPSSHIRLSADNASGVITWEGAGVSDNSPQASDNGGRIAGSVFGNGSAYLYVRCTTSTGDINIRFEDPSSATPLRGSARVRWRPEDQPFGLVSVGSTAKGFKKYQCKNDPGVTMIKIPASKFDMGDMMHSEEPSVVAMSTYYIAETFTTNRQFKKWRDAVAAASGPALTGGWTMPDESYADHPAVFLSWNDARNYSHWLITGLNRDQYEIFLATDAQYEKAMRGAKLRGVRNDAVDEVNGGAYSKIYPWGPGRPDGQKCNYFGCGASNMRPLVDSNGTTAVYDPELDYCANNSYYGLRDACGNVFSWCRDFYTYPRQGGNVDPLVSVQGEHVGRIIRGGSWLDTSDANAFACSEREVEHEDRPNNILGVRPCFKP